MRADPFRCCWLPFAVLIAAVVLGHGGCDRKAPPPRATVSDERFDQAWRNLAARSEEDEVFYIEDDRGAGLMGRVRRTRKEAAPGNTTAPAPPPTEQGPPADEVASVVRQNMPAVKVCYLRLSKETGRSISGRAIVSMKVDKLGQVAEVQVDAPNFVETDLPTCVTQQVKRWSFPKSPNGLALSYPFVFVGG